MTPDRWLAVAVTAPSSDAGALVVEALVRRGARAVVEDPPGTLHTHFQAPSNPTEFLASLSTELQTLLSNPVALSWHWQPHEDWAETWRAGLQPRRVSPRVTVAPTWDRPSKSLDGVLVLIDPGVAFGTAEHASTRGAIRLLDALVRPGERIADVGSGSAILAIVAAKLGAAHVVAVESDPLACPTGLENIRMNEVDAVVGVHELRASPEWLAEQHPLDGIVANIESAALIGLLPGFRLALSDGGWLVVAGILTDESGEFARSAAAHGFRLTDEDRESDWWAASFRADSAESPAASEEAAVVAARTT